MLNIARRQLERSWIFLLACALVLGGFEFLLCAMVASVDVEGAFGEMTKFAPPVFRAMIEQTLMGGSPAAVLAFGWNHPVAHALLSAVAITLAARAIAGEVENGAIELVLAQPVSRAQYFGAHVLFGLCALSAVLAAGLLGTAVGQRVFSLNAFGAGRLAELFLNALLLQLAIYGLTLLASAFGREAGRVALFGVLVAVLSYLVNAIAILWSKAAFLKPYSLHGYFEPREILVQGHLAAGSTLVLAAVAAAAIGLALIRLSRRDLP
jgi:ABC-type transport system involved in multi-copper enzyme maturation permease subunit